MGHVLTGIDEGAVVRVYVNGRHVQHKKPSTGRALAILATPTAYPLVVSVRPDMLRQHSRGRMQMWGQQVGDQIVSPDNMRDISRDLDFEIRGPDDCYMEGSPKFLVTKRPRSMVRVQEVDFKASSETDIYNRKFCERCGVAVPPKAQFCAAHVPVDPLCGHPRSWEDPQPCDLPRLGKLPYCQTHAIEEGLVIFRDEAAPAKRRPGRPRKPGFDNINPIVGRKPRAKKAQPAPATE